MCSRMLNKSSTVNPCQLLRIHSYSASRKQLSPPSPGDLDWNLHITLTCLRVGCYYHGTLTLTFVQPLMSPRSFKQWQHGTKVPSMDCVAGRYLGMGV